MERIILLNRETGRIIYSKELDKIQNISITRTDYIFTYHNGLSEYYKKANINAVMI